MQFMDWIRGIGVLNVEGEIRGRSSNPSVINT